LFFSFLGEMDFPHLSAPLAERREIVMRETRSA
jgi:hypothetical protein